MAEDPFKALKEQPYPRYVAPKPYSFDLNQDMVDMLRREFGADVVTDKLAEALKGKSGGEVEKAATAFFSDLGKAWMQRTIQLADEYPDRTIEVVLETVDRQGNQFLWWPHVPQRYVEVAYLSTQKFLKLPITLNNMITLQYRVPQCAVFAGIKEKCGEDVANMMTCSSYCLAALEEIRRLTETEAEIQVIIEQLASTAKDGFCEFTARKI